MTFTVLFDPAPLPLTFIVVFPPHVPPFACVGVGVKGLTVGVGVGVAVGPAVGVGVHDGVGVGVG